MAADNYKQSGWDRIFLNPYIQDPLTDFISCLGLQCFQEHHVISFLNTKKKCRNTKASMEVLQLQIQAMLPYSSAAPVVQSRNLKVPPASSQGFCMRKRKRQQPIHILRHLAMHPTWFSTRITQKNRSKKGTTRHLLFQHVQFPWGWHTIPVFGLPRARAFFASMYQCKAKEAGGPM